MTGKVALITGITGQDGAYLAEFLLRKGYEVHGIKRRASSFNTSRIDHLYQDPHVQGRHMILHYGDLTDATNLIRIVQEVQPDEIYNLAAQSHVAVSFETPEYTANADAIGTLRLLEAIRILGLTERTRFYQASTSELYGKVQEIPQKETTPFYPRSPYAAAKLYAYWICVNYREAYGMYACNGILFNHECFTSDTPILCRVNGTVDVKTPSELVALRRKGPNCQLFEVPGLEVWDGSQWTNVVGISATRRRVSEADHRLLSIQASGGIVSTTAHHKLLEVRKRAAVRNADGGQGVDIVEEVEARAVHAGSLLKLGDAMPESPGFVRLTEEMAEFLGFLAADGYVPPAPRIVVQFTNNDMALRQRVAELWRLLFLGRARLADGVSGFSGGSVGQLYLTGASKHVVAWLRSMLYSKTGYKRVPAIILNAGPDVQAKFLDAYYQGDGLKAGKGQSVKTNSSLLAQGLYWLYANQGRYGSVYVEYRNGRSYYQINLPTVHPVGNKGAHLRREAAEVRRIDPACPPDDEWVFDLETGSGVVMAGVGRAVVHNSPIRGETFVTRKITRAVARIKLGLQDKLFLGNLDSKRDWGHARDYVEAQWLILQQETPEDFVIATGVQYSVRDFVDLAFAEIGVKLDWTGKGVEEKGIDRATGQERVLVDPRYFRPTEVETLLGDPTKAKTKLGWKAKTSLPEMVTEMMQADIREAERDELCKREGYRIFHYYE